MRGPASEVQGPDVHPLASLAARRAVLEPHRLAATTEMAARALLRQGEATNTRFSYSSAMRYWCAWFAARYGQALSLPVPVPVVVQFIDDHAARRPEAESAEDASSIADQAEESEDPEGDGQPAEAVATPKPKRLQKGRVLTDVITELPPDVDDALVAGGYKGKASAPALATLVHRTPCSPRPTRWPKRAGHGTAALRTYWAPPGQASKAWKGWLASH
ncbi:MAG: hypothetical protein J0I65_21520 [Variovorax sp.]|nr:hypothetical protein [Variovorax sp.]